MARGALPETKTEKEERNTKRFLGDAWVQVVRDALCYTFALHRIPQWYANQTTHPLCSADPRHDRQEVLLGTLSLLRQEGYSCLPLLSNESLQVLMEPAGSSRRHRDADTPRLPKPVVAGETCSSHGQFLLLGDSGWRVYRETEEKKTKCIEYLSKYLANW
ncbi:MAG: hypothetical protein GY772_19750, partial [bacterium]|nr:hypothetical protein [bacterium]